MVRHNKFLAPSKTMLKAIKSVLNNRVGSEVIGALIVIALGAIWTFIAPSDTQKALLVITVLVLLWSVSLLYVYFATTESKLIGTDPARLKKFSQKKRRLAFFGLVATLLLICTGGLVLWIWSTRSQLNSKTAPRETAPADTVPTVPPPIVSVLIANFQGPDPDKFGLTRIFRDGLDDLSTKHADIRIHHLDEAVESKDIAQTRGKERKANIVIWGNYVANQRRARVWAHFTMLDAPAIPPLVDRKIKTNSPSTELEDFTIQDSISEQMSYLVLVASAVLYYAASDYTRALEKFDRAIAMQPMNKADLYICYFYRGTTRNFNGNHKGAIEDLTEATKLQRRFPEAFNNLGIAYSETGNSQKAINSFRKAIEIKENHANAYANLGRAYIERGSFEEADVQLKKAIYYEPNHRNAHLLLSQSFYEQHRYDDAINILNKELKLRGDALVYSLLGLSYSAKGDHENGIVNLRKALEIDPDSAVVRSNVAVAYAHLGDTKEARIHFDKAVELEPGFVQYYDRATFRYFAEDLNGAVDDFKKSIEMNSTFADAYFGVSYAYLSLGQGVPAANAAEAYIGLKGWQPRESQYMALVEHFGYRQSGNIKDAKRILELAAKSADKSVWPYPIFTYLLGKTSSKEIISSTFELQERESPFSKTEPGATALALVPNKPKATAARTYIGLDLALAADATQALIHLRWVQANGVKNVYEYQLALSNLNQLKNR